MHNPFPHHHPQMPHAFPGLGGLHYHSLPCSSHLIMEWTGNGDCSSRKGKSAEIGQCDSEISRRGLSSSLDFNFSSTCPTLISSSPLSQTSRNKWKLSTYNKGKWKHPFSERQKSPFHCLCDAPSMPYNRVIQYSVLGGGASSHSLVAMVAGPF